MSDVWPLLERERLAMADFLETLTPEQWDVQSLCDAWKVRDVAAHLAWASSRSPFQSALGLARFGFRFNTFIAETAKRFAEAGPAATIARLRAVAPLKRHPPGTKKVDPLVDILCHNLDIRRPLQLPRPMPVDAFVLGAARLSGMGFPFGTKKRIAGLRLVADDAGWSTGAGPEVHGQAEAMLLALSARPVPPGELTGDGAAELYRRISSS